MFISRPRLAPVSLTALLATGARLAFVPARAGPSKLAETLAALANSHGGNVLIGVSAGGHVVGIDDVDQERDMVQAAELLPSPPLIGPMPEMLQLEDKAVCVDEVPPGLPHVYALNGRYLTRSGTRNRLLTTAELSGLLLERSEAGFESRIVAGASLDDLDLGRIESYLDVVEGLSDIGFVEQLGYGIDRMVTIMAEAGLPAPVFEETVAGFRVALRGRGEELVSSELAPRWGNRVLTTRQEQALAYVAQHGRITNREFHELVPDVSDETIRRDLADLVDQGLIMKVGDRKATYYILK
jgi:predicted HTH transcriptional regulator